MVFENITYYMIFNIPLIAIGGILTFLLMIFTASIPYLQKKGYKFANYNLHVRLAIIVIILSFLHGLLFILTKF
jgi:hypothetical protein